MKDKFTLKDALIVVKNHLLFSISIFIISFFGVKYLDFIPKEFKSVHTISLSKVMNQDNLDIHDKSTIVNLIASKDFRNKLLNKTSKENISNFYFDKHQQSKDLVTVIFKGNSADSVFNTATIVMDFLVEMDMNAIDKWKEMIDIQQENNLKQLKELQLSEKSFSNNLPQDKIEHYSKMQNSYNDLLEKQIDSTSADLTNNVASIVRLENDIVSLRIAIQNKILSTKDIINELNFAANSVKIISYLVPPSKQSASLYFPNALVYLGCALIIMLLYNFIVLNYNIRKYMK